MSSLKHSYPMSVRTIRAEGTLLDCAWSQVASKTSQLNQPFSMPGIKGQ